MQKRIIALLTTASLFFGSCTFVNAAEEPTTPQVLGKDIVTYTEDFLDVTYTSESKLTVEAATNDTKIRVGNVDRYTRASELKTATGYGKWNLRMMNNSTSTFDVTAYLDTDGVAMRTQGNKEDFAVLEFVPETNISELKKLELDIESGNDEIDVRFFSNLTNNSYSMLHICRQGAASAAGSFARMVEMTAGGLVNPASSSATPNIYMDDNRMIAGSKTQVINVANDAFVNRHIVLDFDKQASGGYKVTYTITDTVDGVDTAYTPVEVTLTRDIVEGQALMSVVLLQKNAAPGAYVKVKNVEMEWYDSAVPSVDTDTRTPYYRLYDSDNSEITDRTVLELAEGEERQLSTLIKGVANSSTVTWTAKNSDGTANSSVVSVDATGKITANATSSGSELETVTVTDTNGTADTADDYSMSVKVKVMGELDLAVKNGTYDTGYKVTKAASISAINALMSAETFNETAFLNMFRDETSGGLAYLKDLKIVPRLAGLSDDDIKALGKRIHSYYGTSNPLTFATSDDAYEFVEYFEKELKTDALCKIADADEATAMLAMETAIAGATFGCNTDTDETSETYNEYYAEHRDYVLGILLNKDDYKNALDVKATFDKYLVFAEIKDTISYEKIAQIVGEHPELGYDTAHYAGITDKSALGSGIKNGLAGFATPDALNSYINSFQYEIIGGDAYIRGNTLICPDGGEVELKIDYYNNLTDTIVLNFIPNENVQVSVKDNQTVVKNLTGSQTAVVNTYILDDGRYSYKSGSQTIVIENGEGVAEYTAPELKPFVNNGSILRMVDIFSR